MRPHYYADRVLQGLGRGAILALATGGVGLVGALDHLTGYEVSMSVLYLGPVAIAAWYAGWPSAAAVAVLSCLVWYVADFTAGHPYSSPAIPVWNALVRLGFFLVTGFLLSALRNSLSAQQELARRDALTGLYGRREFDARLSHDLAQARRRGTALTLGYVDVDDFKAVNDAHGHGGGDRVLCALADVLDRSLRQADTAARLGGDEFALVLPDTDGERARRVVLRLGQSFRDDPVMSAWGITASIGVVTFIEIPAAREQVVAAADHLMYEVKRSGKGAVAFTVLGQSVQPDAASKV